MNLFGIIFDAIADSAGKHRTVYDVIVFKFHENCTFGRLWSGIHQCLFIVVLHVPVAELSTCNGSVPDIPTVVTHDAPRASVFYLYTPLVSKTTTNQAH